MGDMTRLWLVKLKRDLTLKDFDKDHEGRWVTEDIPVECAKKDIANKLKKSHPDFWVDGIQDWNELQDGIFQENIRWILGN